MLKLAIASKPNQSCCYNMLKRSDNDFFYQRFAADCLYLFCLLPQTEALILKSVNLSSLTNTESPWLVHKLSNTESLSCADREERPRWKQDSTYLGNQLPNPVNTYFPSSSFYLFFFSAVAKVLSNIYLSWGFSLNQLRRFGPETSSAFVMSIIINVLPHLNTQDCTHYLCQ